MTNNEFDRNVAILRGKINFCYNCLSICCVVFLATKLYPRFFKTHVVDDACVFAIIWLWYLVWVFKRDIKYAKKIYKRV